MQDHAKPIRMQLIQSAIPKLTPDQSADAQILRSAEFLASARIRAINKLGSKWVLSPSYNASRCAHHNPSFKKSAVLEVFLQGRMAREMGRV